MCMAKHFKEGYMFNVSVRILACITKTIEYKGTIKYKILEGETFNKSFHTRN